MKTSKLIDEDLLIYQAVHALLDRLGPVEAARFLALPRKPRLESVQRHREWQDSLDKDTFFNEIFEA